jgi:hypothetical protein
LLMCLSAVIKQRMFLLAIIARQRYYRLQFFCSDKHLARYVRDSRRNACWTSRKVSDINVSF